MNERIKQLAEQAEDWADNQNFYESDYRDYLMEKFAELIVNECCEMMLDMETKYPANLTVREIKKHFGGSNV